MLLLPPHLCGRAVTPVPRDCRAAMQLDACRARF